MTYKRIILILAVFLLYDSLAISAARAQVQMNIEEREELLYQDSTAHMLTAKEFIHQAALKNMYEIRTGELALLRAHNTTVLQFARKMIDNHTRSTHYLNQVVQRLEMDEGLIPKELDARYQRQFEALQTIPADNFDIYYISDQRRIHEQAVEFYSKYIENKQRDDPEHLYQYAIRTLPILEKHANILRQVDNLVLSGR